MATITIGPGAISRPGWITASRTTLHSKNPADGTGTLNTMSIWGKSSMNAVKCGTFYGSSSSYTNRAYQSIGNISNGLQTFSGLAVSVVINDILGIFATSGFIYVDTENVSTGNYYYLTSDGFSGTNSYGSVGGGYEISIEAIGQTVATGKKWNGITISKWNGVLVSKINNV